MDNVEVANEIFYSFDFFLQFFSAVAAHVHAWLHVRALVQVKKVARVAAV